MASVARKRIVVDFEKLRVLETGLGQFCLQLADSLAAHRQPDEELIYFVPPYRKNLCAKFGVRLKSVHRWKKNEFCRAIRGLTYIAPGPQYDLWHITNQASRYRPWNPKTPVLLTIHDLNFLREKSPEGFPARLQQVQRLIDGAARVTVISKFVADEVRQFLDLRGKQLDIVYNGVTNIDHGEVRRPTHAPDGPFFFSIGYFAAKKNFHTIVQMLPHLSGARLVLAGVNDNQYGDYVRRIAAEAGVADRLTLTGPISDEDRQWYYSNCRAFLFPSLTEGFGLPPVEAMAAGRPTFLSTLTSLPEIGGDAAFYWHDFEPKSMARVVRECLAAADVNPGFSQRVSTHAKQFCWQRAARQYLSIYREMIADNSAGSRSRATLPVRRAS